MSSESESFPTEIVFEILSRLPVESLLRCKSVCKSWRSLISDPHFIKFHLTLSSTNHHCSNHHLLVSGYVPANLKSFPVNDVIFDHSTNHHYSNHHLLVSGYGPATLKSFPVNDVIFDHNTINPLELDHPLKDPDLSQVRILGSCNGLICLHVTLVIMNQNSEDLDDGIRESHYSYNLFIWNPSTRKSIQLPEPPCFNGVVLHGFGYYESSDDYKVVEMTQFNRDDNIVMMYSSKNGNWKEIGRFPHWISSNSSGVFVNGALHWIANEHYDDSWIIVSLDLAKEDYGHVLLPVDDEVIFFRKADNVEVVMELKLGILGDCLCVLCDFSRNSMLFCADVWVMKVYGVKDSWAKVFSIPYESVNDFIRHDLGRLFLPPLCVSDDGKVLLQFESSLIVFDSKDNSALEIHDCVRCSNAWIFVESLVSPSGTPPGRDLLADALAGVSSLKI